MLYFYKLPSYGLPQELLHKKFPQESQYPSDGGRPPSISVPLREIQCSHLSLTILVLNTNDPNITSYCTPLSHGQPRCSISFILFYILVMSLGAFLYNASVCIFVPRAPRLRNSLEFSQKHQTANLPVKA